MCVYGIKKPLKFDLSPMRLMLKGQMDACSPDVNLTPKCENEILVDVPRGHFLYT